MKEMSSRSIPYETIDPPGDRVLYDLSQPPEHFYKPYFLKILNPNNVEIQKKFIEWKAQPAVIQQQIECSMWMCALRWLYKKRWNPKYKLAEISPNKKERDLLEPFSDLLHSALLLCEQCYLYVGKFGYSHHLIWFHAVALELQRFGFNCPQGTEKLVKRLRACAKNLRDNQNPINPSQYPALWQLMEASLVLANSDIDKGFRNKYLTRMKPRRQRGNIYEVGFISAISSWATQVHTNPELCSMESTSSEISFNTGSGKGVQTVSQKKLEKWVSRIEDEIRVSDFKLF